MVLSQDTLVITLHEALSPAERDLARSPEGAAQVEEFHRQLFSNSSQSLREEIRRITGVDVREAVAEVAADGGGRRPGIHEQRDGAGLPPGRRRARVQLERGLNRAACDVSGNRIILAFTKKTDT